jgi:3-hydroxyacyl-CoA dehydrogenase
MPVHYEIRDRVAVLTVDNPPVNALSVEIWQGLAESVRRADRDAAADAIVLIGAGTTFVAGADINIFRTLKTRDESLARSAEMHALLAGIEDAGKPVVAAIHGNALGGGLELAMSCHYRVAAGDARVGQPEVLLGLIPGAGGTQRLPRLTDPATALSMCTDGRPIPAARAAAAGIIDRVVEGDLLSGAIAFSKARAGAGERRKTRDIRVGMDKATVGIEACRQARLTLAGVKGARAAMAAVGAIEACYSESFDTGSLRERELFADCVTSTESKALRHLFFAEREAAKVPGIPKDAPVVDIRRAAVVGAGTMGGGIAMAYANAGIPVLLKDVDAASLERGLGTIRNNYESSVAKGRLTREALEATLALITPTTTYNGFDHVDIVVEAVFEDMKLKKATFAELARVTSAHCILASNTSTLDIDGLSEASGRPGQVIGHHFFSPANVMKLLEVVRAKDSSPSTIASSVKLGRRLGKVPVVVGNSFGFVANRLLAPYLREAYRMLEEGASVSQVDEALTNFGMPVGPFGMEDIAGIDVGARIRQYLAAGNRGPAGWAHSAVADRLFEMGRYGQKSGAGWYRYEPGSRTRIPDPLVEQLAAEEAAARGVTRREITEEEIVARTMTALANEGAHVLEEGVASRPGDIDVIYCYGFGYPRYRGGPMFYAHTIGLSTVLDSVKTYRAELGDHWRPAPLLERLVADGRSFYDD